MNDQPAETVTSFLPVPEVLHSFETGEPFSHCVDCKKYLLDDGTVYIIQKAFKGAEVLVEFAYCTDCHDRLASSYSKESFDEIWNFFLDRVNFTARGIRLLAESWTDFDAWTRSCITCGTARDETPSYLLAGQCDGPDLVFHTLPYLICENCEIALHGVLSTKSRDIWDEWIERTLDVPPSIRQDIRDGKLVFV